MPPTLGTKQYRFLGMHAEELEVGDTRPQVGYGDFIELSPEDIKKERTAELIKLGLLVDTGKLQAASEAEAAKAETTEDEKGGK